MNCKPGDLAVMTASDFPRNVGALFRVIGTYRCDPGDWYVEALSACDGSLGPISPGDKVWATDSCLRPIRDNDGEDETLQWAGKPERVTA